VRFAFALTVLLGCCNPNDQTGCWQRHHLPGQACLARGNPAYVGAEMVCFSSPNEAAEYARANNMKVCN
jgi:hypothetical protein